MLLTGDYLKQKFEQALSYEQFVASGEPLGHRMQWDQRHGQLQLDSQQTELVAGFTRTLNVLTLTGTWCGDCALQGAALQRIAETNPQCINLRFLPKTEEHADLIVKCSINSGFRVPVTWFMAEDFEPVSRIGDRTLSRYRSMALKQLPPEQANILAPPQADPVREVLIEVLQEYERVHLLLRTSARLRQKHGD